MKTDIYDPADSYGRNGENIYARNAMRTLRAQRRAGGLCSQCGVAADAGARCARCQAARRQREHPKVEMMTPTSRKRIRFAMQKLQIAERMLREARLELKQAVAASIPPKSDGDGERKQAAA